MCFLELLGLDSLKLRVDMKVANIILNYKCGNEDAQYNSIRESLGTAPLCCLFYLKDKGQIGLKHLNCEWLGKKHLSSLSSFFYRMFVLYLISLGPLMGF